MKIFNQKNILIAVSFVVLVAVLLISYRMFLQFKSKDVAFYINEEASNYKGNETTVARIINDGVKHIKASNYLTKQVLRYAEANGTPKEKELVNAAISHCKTSGFIG